MKRTIVGLGISCALTLTAIPVAAQTVTDYEVIDAPALIAPRAERAALTEIAVAGDRLVAVGDYGLILSRGPSDSAWVQATVPTSILFTAVSFADADNGWAVGHHGVIVRTTDGGSTWQRQLDGFQFIELQQAYWSGVVEDLNAAIEASEDDAEIEDLEWALDNAIFQAENADFAAEEGPTKPFLDVIAIDKDTLLVAGAYGTLMRSTDGGANWQLLDATVENPDGYHFNGLAQGSDYLFLAGEAGQIFRSADQGDSWEVLDSPYYGSFFGLHVDRSNRLWVAGLRGNIFRSDDQGENFTQIRLEDTVNINSITDAADGGVYLVGNAGVVGYVNNQGEVEQQTHSSGAALTDVVLNVDGSLTLVGQRGVLSLDSFQSASVEQE